MKVRVAFAVLGLAIGALVTATAAEATTYNLTSDYSNANNPNGPWSYNFAGSPLPHQGTPVANGNPYNAAIPAGGYFSTGNDLNNNSPDVFKAAVNGTTVGGTNGDFLAGDVLIHSANDGGVLTIVWTAPTAGIIDNLDFSIWYAHSPVDRSNDVTFSLGSSVFNFVTSKIANSDRNAAGGLSGGPFSVNAGDLLTLSFAKTVGQSFGSLTGVALAFDFNSTAVTPIPTTLPLFMSGLAGLGWLAQRRRNQAA